MLCKLELINSSQDVAVYFYRFMAFSQLAYLMFGSDLYDFSSFVIAAETLFSVMLGEYQ